jgi:membrane dipeptidase
MTRDAAPLIFDGLIVAKWSPEVFRDMRRGGLTAANCTCCVWENFDATMRNLAVWNNWFRDYPDLIAKARSVADIRRAREENRTAIVLGLQNVSAFEDRLGAIQLFKDVGVGIAQIAYNTQNFVGTGCYESRDSGLSDFGRDVVAEMNRVGIMCDLSHVGPVTSRDVIVASCKPVCYSHCLPAALKPHPRNKSDDELRFIAERGGFVGVTMFPPFLPKGSASTVDDYVAAIGYVIDLIGEDRVGIGTDFTQGHGPEFFRWITHDKGDGRKLTEFGEVINPEGFRTIAEYPNLIRAMQRAGWSSGRIEKVVGENWLRVLVEVWGD